MRGTDDQACVRHVNKVHMVRMIFKSSRGQTLAPLPHPKLQRKESPNQIDLVYLDLVYLDLVYPETLGDWDIR